MGGGPGSDTTAIHQGGDSYGSDIVIGTLDAHDTVIQAAGALAWRVDHVTRALLPEEDKSFAIGSLTKRVARIFSDRFDVFSDAGGLLTSVSELGVEFGDGVVGHSTDVLLFRDVATRELSVATHSGTYALTPPIAPLTTKGDLYAFTTVAARLAAGSNGQFLTSDNTTPTGLKWVTGSGTTDAAAWHNTLDTFGAAKKIGTVDDYPFAIYSHNLNVGSFYDPRGSGVISGFSGMAFLSSLSTPGDQIYWLKNMDATPGADSSCELQFSSDVATLQIFTLNSNNPPRSPGGGIFDMASNEASIFAYNNPLNIVTGLDHPIQFILDGARMAYMDTTGFHPQVDASIALTTLGTAANRWNSVHAFYGVLDALTVGTFGATATAEGEIQAGVAGGWRWFVRDDGTNIINEFVGMAGRDVYIPIIGRGGSGTTHSTTLQFINTDNKTTYISFPESGYVKDAVAEAGFFSITGYTGIGVRVNINGTDNSGWSIDSSGKMTIYAAELGLYGHATVAQQTVAGSRGGNAALTDLLTKLSATGIIIDGSSA